MKFFNRNAGVATKASSSKAVINYFATIEHTLSDSPHISSWSLSSSSLSSDSVNHHIRMGVAEFVASTLPPEMIIHNPPHLCEFDHPFTTITIPRPDTTTRSSSDPGQQIAWTTIMMTVPNEISVPIRRGYSMQTAQQSLSDLNKVKKALMLYQQEQENEEVNQPGKGGRTGMDGTDHDDMWIIHRTNAFDEDDEDENLDLLDGSFLNDIGDDDEFDLIPDASSTPPQRAPCGVTFTNGRCFLSPITVPNLNIDTTTTTEESNRNFVNARNIKNKDDEEYHPVHPPAPRNEGLEDTRSGGCFSFSREKEPIIVNEVMVKSDEGDHSHIDNNNMLTTTIKNKVPRLEKIPAMGNQPHKNGCRRCNCCTRTRGTATSPVQCFCKSATFYTLKKRWMIRYRYHQK